MSLSTVSPRPRPALAPAAEPTLGVAGLTALWSAGVQLRPVDAERDPPWLAALYASTRAAEVGSFGWPPAAQQAFLDLQFRLQALQHAAQHPRADDAVIVAGGEDVGRLRVDRSGPRWRLVDIALLPAWQGRGIGQALLAALCAEADAAGREIELGVRRDNLPAARLYTRLGFVEHGPGSAAAAGAETGLAARAVPTDAMPAAGFVEGPADLPPGPYLSMRRPPRPVASDASADGPSTRAGPRGAPTHRVRRSSLRANRSSR